LKRSTALPYRFSGLSRRVWEFRIQTIQFGLYITTGAKKSTHRGELWL